MKRKAIVPIAIILMLLALGLAACGPEIEERATRTASGLDLEETPTATPDDSYLDKSQTTTESGLHYTEIERGDGPAPEPGDIVTIHYSAWLEDGTALDNTYDSGQPVSFILGQEMVIKGWDEGVALMHEGGKAVLVAPRNWPSGRPVAVTGRCRPTLRSPSR